MQATATPKENPVFPVAGRNCDGCTMCCKLGAIKELNKPDGQWCPHCKPGTGCGIYDTRPAICRGYHCYFLLSDLGEEWRPSTCKFMVSLLANGAVHISVDATRPDGWRREPYFSLIRQWSKDHRVMVLVGTHAYGVCPDRIDDLGMVDDDHLLTGIEERTPTGVIQRTVKVHRKDLLTPPSAS